MGSTMSPRLLRLLRVEDEAIPVSKELAVEDLGRIGEWGNFVRGLGRGQVVTIESSTKGQRIRALPEFVAVDFRFHEDSSIPRLRPGRDEEADPVLSQIRWSQHLAAPNAGVVIGATLMGVASQKDLPTVTTLHTLVPDDTRNDVTTLLLVGQMLACGGRDFPEGESPVKLAYLYLARLPNNHHSAVLSMAELFRSRLKARCGVGEVSTEPICLFVAPDSLGRLLCEFDASRNTEDLDERLTSVGLEIWDRDGDGDCLDLRSLFMDRLEASHPDRPWGMLPLATVKRKESGESGDVLAWVEDLTRELGDGYLAAAKVVRSNLDGVQMKIVELKHPFVRLLGVVFAVLEEQLRLAQTFEINLALPWEPVKNLPADEATAPTLGQQIRVLARVMDGMGDFFKPGRMPSDGYLPLSGRSASIRQVLQKFVAEYPEGPDATVIRSVLRPGEGEDEALRHLLEHLVTAGLVERVDREISSADGHSQHRSFFKLLRKPGKKLVARSPTVDDVRIADLLGFEASAKPKGHTNELPRILRDCGYRDHHAFRSRLYRGPVPAHIAQAARWYRERFHPTLPPSAWPGVCRFE